MNQSEWKIGKFSFISKEEYDLAMRDMALIRILRHEENLEEAEIAKKIYHRLRNQKDILTSKVGRAFLRELSSTSHAPKKQAAQEYENDAASYYEQPSISNRTSSWYETDDELDSDNEHIYKPVNMKKILLLTGALFSCLLLFYCIVTYLDYESNSTRNEDAITELKDHFFTKPEVVEQDDLVQSNNNPPLNESLYSVEFPGILQKYAALYQKNPDIIGWISIPGTVVDYPVMQTLTDEEYYIHRNFEKRDNDEGLPFLDIRCVLNQPSTNFIIYGHNMKNGHMFASLLNYASEDYYKEHTKIQFDTIYEEGSYEIISVFATEIAYENQETFRYYQFIHADSVLEFYNYIKEVKALSLYDTGVTADYGDHLITLSTCEYSMDDGRFVVVARKKTERNPL